MNGVKVNDKNYIIKVKAFVCDAPARAFVKGIVGHNAYNGCEKCCISGDWNDKAHHVVYNESDCTLRTDATFRQRVHEEHHKLTSPIEELPIDVINTFPLDYMHLVLLGVQKKMLKMWISGSAGFLTKLSAKDITDISTDLKSAVNLPKEIGRAVRGLEVINFWKATEFQTFLLKTGPVVMHDRMNNAVYQHFLLLHSAITICSNGHL